MNPLFVTLKSSENENLKYPCNGTLELFEIGTDGQLISGVWRGLNPNGGYYAPCAVRNVEFVYPAVDLTLDGKLRSLFDLIGQERFGEARVLIAELEMRNPECEPELVRASALMHFLEG